MDHVNWAHTFLLMGKVPESENDKRSYIAVYREAVRAGDGFVTRGMVENAAQSPELYEALTGESLNREPEPAPVFDESVRISPAGDREAPLDLQIAADYLERLYSWEVRGDRADHPHEIANLLEDSGGTLLGQILAACAIALGERIEVEGQEGVMTELDSSAEVMSYGSERSERNMRQAQLLVRRYLRLPEPPREFAFTDSESRIDLEDTRGVTVTLASMALRAVKSIAQHNGVPTKDAAAGFIHVLRMRSLDAQVTREAIPPMKTCPRCAESVKEAAQVCRFCGHEF